MTHRVPPVRIGAGTGHGRQGAAKRRAVILGDRGERHRLAFASIGSGLPAQHPLRHVMPDMPGTLTDHLIADIHEPV